LWHRRTKYVDPDDKELFNLNVFDLLCAKWQRSFDNEDCVVFMPPHSPAMCELMSTQGENFFLAQRANLSKTGLFENSEYVLNLCYLSCHVSFSISLGLVILVFK